MGPEKDFRDIVARMEKQHPELAEAQKKALEEDLPFRITREMRSGARSQNKRHEGILKYDS